MRLISPSAGEAFDRLTILRLKIAAAAKVDNQKALIDFDMEKESIELYLKDHQYVVSETLGEELQKINARLWDLEDEQRRLMKLFPEKEPTTNWPMQSADTFMFNAYQVVQLNDARAETVKKINQANGFEQQEKIYAASN